MDIQNHQQLCSFNELSRSRGSRVGSCRSLTASWPLGAEQNHCTASATCPHGDWQQGLMSPPTTDRDKSASNQTLPSTGTSAGSCTGVGSGGEAAPADPCPIGTPSAAASGHTWSTRSDPVGLAGSAPPSPCWSHPEQPRSQRDPPVLPLPAGGGFQEPVKALFPLLAGPSTFGTSSSPCGHQGSAKLFRIKSLISFPLGSKHAEREDFQTSKPHLSPAGAPRGPPLIPTPISAFPARSSRLLARSRRFWLCPSSSELILLCSISKDGTPPGWMSFLQPLLVGASATL